MQVIIMFVTFGAIHKKVWQISNYWTFLGEETEENYWICRRPSNVKKDRFDYAMVVVIR